MPPLILRTEDAIRSRFPRVAITHEWLTIPGGSERVVLEMLELFPAAELFTAVYDPEPWPEAIRDRPVHVSFLDRIPGARRHYPRLLPLMNAAFESFDLSGFDLVLSSNHACAKNVVTPPGTAHVCYCHTPMRYAWDPSFLEGENLGPVGRAVARGMIPRLRRQEVVTAFRPDVYVANSSHVAARIAKFYRRPAHVVHPPVDVAPLLATPKRAAGRGHYLCFGRLVPYKRIDLAVAACTQLGRPLKVAGTGRDLERLRQQAGPTVEFLGHVPEGEVPELLAGARALLFPGEEDFGIVPVEAQAAGTPVIAFGIGGARDSVIEDRTGLFFDAQTPAALADAILRFEARDWDPEEARRNARSFGPEVFRGELARVLGELDDVAASTAFAGREVA
jgi:glycosyltransferase involved in cell wall biosynthesis